MSINQKEQIWQLQKPIVLMLVIWVLFLVSFTIAWFRVSNQEPFSGKPFREFEKEEPTLNQP